MVERESALTPASLTSPHLTSPHLTSLSLFPLQPKAAETLRASTGGEVLAVACDVRDFEAVLEMVGRVLSHFGRLDICVNGAAGNFLAQADSLSSRAFRTVMEIDTLGTFNVSRAVFDKCMREHGGSIINITATLHLNGVPMQAHAAAAKAAIEGFTRVLCNEWGCHGVRVNCLAPGPIADTEGFRRLGGCRTTGTHWTCSPLTLYPPSLALTCNSQAASCPRSILQSTDGPSRSSASAPAW